MQFSFRITCSWFGRRAASRTIVTRICSSITLFKQCIFILQACFQFFTCAYAVQRIVLYVDQNTLLLVKSPVQTIVPLYSLLCHNIGNVRPTSMGQGLIRISESAMSVLSIIVYFCTLDRGDKGHLHRHLRLSSFVFICDGFSGNSIICHYQPLKMQPSKGIPVFLTLWGFLNWPLAEAWRVVLRVNAGGGGISW